MFAAVARAVLDGNLPIEPKAQQAAMRAHLERMNATLQAMPPATQREVSNLLALLVLAPGRIALTGLYSGWTQAATAEVQTALRAMRASRLHLRRQVYHALRDLTHAAFFSDRTSWALLSYPGPQAMT